MLRRLYRLGGRIMRLYRGLSLSVLGVAVDAAGSSSAPRLEANSAADRRNPCRETMMDLIQGSLLLRCVLGVELQI